MGPDGKWWEWWTFKACFDAEVSLQCELNCEAWNSGMITAFDATAHSPHSPLYNCPFISARIVNRKWFVWKYAREWRRKLSCAGVKRIERRRGDSNNSRRLRDDTQILLLLLFIIIYSTASNEKIFLSHIPHFVVHIDISTHSRGAFRRPEEFYFCFSHGFFLLALW